ncbi:MAG: hypothetical protein JW882_03290 [Deltaproteobacteria bacterium]|nr:hypothetical protein [Deltaproteobacteria bacterium]
MKSPDILDAIRPVIKAFEKLGILYYIGGSIASSAWGLARATMDVDMVSVLKKEHAHPLAEMLKSEYYIDEEMILDAVKRKSSFNIIHLETMFKIDIFLKKSNSYSEVVFKRKRKENLDEENCDVEFFIASSEDIILNKLEWFRKGGEIAERQWHDILGVIKVQGNLLDKEYLYRWAGELGVKDLLEKAFTESGNFKF